MQLYLEAPTRVIAPPGSAIAGNVWFDFPVRAVNTSSKVLWLHGYSLDSPFYSYSTRKTDSSRWTKGVVGYCGTGAGVHEFDPGVITLFHVSVPAQHTGRQIRVELNIYGSPTDSKPVIVRSEAALIQ